MFLFYFMGLMKIFLQYFYFILVLMDILTIFLFYFYLTRSHNIVLSGSNGHILTILIFYTLGLIKNILTILLCYLFWVWRKYSQNIFILCYGSNEHILTIL